MLDTLDVLIGFTLIMLIVSMVATMVTQGLITWLNLRGSALRKGVADLLALMDRGLRPADARRIADHLLRNPLVGQPSLFGSRRLAAAIHREELAKLVLDFAAQGDAEKMAAEEEAGAGKGAPAAAPAAAGAGAGAAAPPRNRLHEVMLKSLGDNGLSLPAEKLKAIRLELLKLEETMPHLSNDARATAALLKHASSEFLAKLNAWFDQTMDRVTDRFTLRARAVTVIVSVLLAFALQLDSIGLINRLSLDEGTRNALVARALGGIDTLDPAARAQPPQAGELGDVIGMIARNKNIQDLATLRLIEVPTSLNDWIQRWRRNGPAGLPGILLSAALLSLGAPFWYELLKNMVKLRSVVATKDDRQRNERQSTQAPSISDSLAGSGGEARS
jgi:hypothetical protein